MRQHRPHDDSDVVSRLRDDVALDLLERDFQHLADICHRVWPGQLVGVHRVADRTGTRRASFLTILVEVTLAPAQHHRQPLARRFVLIIGEP